MKTHLSLVGAHGGYASKKIPLGGGATVFECLVEAWAHHPDLHLEILAPGPAYPLLDPIFARHNSPYPLHLTSTHPASLSYFDYARFSRRFERATTDFLISRRTPPNAWILANDICEGPDLLRLKAHGYRIITLVHVDVVDFVSRLYLRGRIAPEALTRLWRNMRSFGLTFLAPDILKLIFDKQESAYTGSDLIVVPSQNMKEIVMECYPTVKPSNIEVVHWGYPSLHPPQPPSPQDLSNWKQKWEIMENAFVVLTLSRISPEKGIDRLLSAALLLEKRSPDLSARLHLIIAGGAAYMDGPRYLRKLKQLVSRLRTIRVTFPGHLTGTDKACAFEASDLYAFLSKHESYGLTLSEALATGLPAIVSPEVASKHPPSPHFKTVETSPEALVAELEVCMNLSREKKKFPKKTELFSSASETLLDLIKQRS